MPGLPETLAVDDPVKMPFCLKKELIRDWCGF